MPGCTSMQAALRRSIVLPRSIAPRVRLLIDAAPASLCSSAATWWLVRRARWPQIWRGRWRPPARRRLRAWRARAAAAAGRGVFDAAAGGRRLIIVRLLAVFRVWCAPCEAALLLRVLPLCRHATFASCRRKFAAAKSIVRQAYRLGQLWVYVQAHEYGCRARHAQSTIFGSTEVSAGHVLQAERGRERVGVCEACMGAEIGVGVRCSMLCKAPHAARIRKAHAAVCAWHGC